jgi:hypothetical protein
MINRVGKMCVAATSLCMIVLIFTRKLPPPRGCAGSRIGTTFLRPRGSSPLKGANPAGTRGIEMEEMVDIILLWDKPTTLLINCCNQILL